MQAGRLNLYDVTAGELGEQLAGRVNPPFRARQIASWILERGVDSFEQMSNLPLPLRDELAEAFTLEMPEIVSRTEPASDGTRKYLFALVDGNLVESVYMPMATRVSLCLSSQAGCAVGCTFCVTGFYGGGRNLRPSEIIGQLLRLRSDLQVPWETMNVVFMGMGEPLLNLDNVATALEYFYGHIAPRRITLSTSGIVPGIDALARMDRRPNLAVSINAPDQQRREEIMPITRKYPLDELIESLRRFPLEKDRELTAEYVLLAGYNDSADDARALARLLRGLNVKVNAIPFNPDPNLPEWMERPRDPAIDRFASTLVRAGTRVTVRRSKGDDIAAACGQLRGRTDRPRSDRRPSS